MKVHVSLPKKLVERPCRLRSAVILLKQRTEFSATAKKMKPLRQLLALARQWIQRQLKRKDWSFQSGGSAVADLRYHLTPQRPTIRYLLLSCA